MNNELLPNILDFGIGSAFSKALGSAFSENTGLAPGPFYAICDLFSLRVSSISFQQFLFYFLSEFFLFSVGNFVFKPFQVNSVNLLKFSVSFQLKEDTVAK